MNYRHAKYLANGCIDCEIEHPKYGWIPFTLDPADTSAAVDAAELFERITTAGAAAAYVQPPPNVAQIIASLTAAVQAHLDSAAQAAGYDTIYTAVSYADEPAVPKFQIEGAAFRAWRSLVWAVANTLRAEVEAGTRPVPTATQLIAELPTLTLPSPD